MNRKKVNVFLRTLKERKAVFTAYQDEIAEARHQSRKEAKRKLKQDYLDLLSVTF